MNFRTISNFISMTKGKLVNVVEGAKKDAEIIPEGFELGSSFRNVDTGELEYVSSGQVNYQEQYNYYDVATGRKVFVVRINWLSDLPKPSAIDDKEIAIGSYLRECDNGQLYVYGGAEDWAPVAEGGGSSNPFMHIGTIDQTTTSFPTTRPDGSELVNGDFLKIRPDAEVPFTIEGITFNSVKDQATWLEDHWDLNANPYQNTYETPVKNKSTESLSGLAVRQNKVNEEFAEAIKNGSAVIINATDSFELEPGIRFPMLTTGLVTKAYNAMKAGKPVLVIDMDGAESYAPVSAIKDDDNEITLSFIYKDKYYVWFKTDSGDTNPGSSNIITNWNAITEVEGTLPSTSATKKTNTIYKLKNSTNSSRPDGYYYCKSGSFYSIDNQNFFSVPQKVIDNITVPNIDAATFRKIIDIFITSYSGGKTSLPIIYDISTNWFPVLRVQRVHGSQMKYRITIKVDEETLAIYEQADSRPTDTPTITLRKLSDMKVVLEVIMLPSGLEIRKDTIYKLTTERGGYTPGYYYHNGSDWVKISTTKTLVVDVDTLPGYTTAEKDIIYHVKNDIPGGALAGFYAWTDDNELRTIAYEYKPIELETQTIDGVKIPVLTAELCTLLYWYNRQGTIPRIKWNGRIQSVDLMDESMDDLIIRIPITESITAMYVEDRHTAEVTTSVIKGAISDHIIEVEGSLPTSDIQLKTIYRLKDSTEESRFDGYYYHNGSSWSLISDGEYYIDCLYTTVDGYNVPNITKEQWLEIAKKLYYQKRPSWIICNAKNYAVTQCDQTAKTFNIEIQPGVYAVYHWDGTNVNISVRNIIPNINPITSVTGTLPDHPRTDTIYKLKFSSSDFWPDGFYYFNSGWEAIINHNRISCDSTTVEGVNVWHLTANDFQKILTIIDASSGNPIMIPIIEDYDGNSSVLSSVKKIDDITDPVYRLIFRVDEQTVVYYDQPISGPTEEPSISIVKQEEYKPLIPVPSIRSDNDAVIDTAIENFDYLNWKIEARIKHITKSNQPWPTLFGGNPSGNYTNASYGYQFSRDNDDAYTRQGSSEVIIPNAWVGLENEWVDISLTHKEGEQVLTIGDKTGTQSLSGAYGSNPIPPAILGVSKLNSPISEFMWAEIASFKIWSNGILVRDYIPMKNLATGKYGLFDMVDNIFQTSANSNEFKIGSKPDTIDVKVDNVTTDFNSNKEIEVKDGGLESKHLKTGVLETEMPDVPSDDKWLSTKAVADRIKELEDKMLIPASYISSNGAVIDSKLNYFNYQNWKIEGRVKVLSKSNVSWPIFFGGNPNNYTWSAAYGFMFNRDDNNVWTRQGEAATIVYNAWGNIDNKWTDFSLSSKEGEQILTIGGSTGYTALTNAVRRDSFSPGIFGCRTYPNVGEAPMLVQIEWLKVYTDGTLVRDYIPMYNIALNKYGIFDRIDRLFQYEDINGAATLTGSLSPETPTLSSTKTVDVLKGDGTTETLEVYVKE